jgi:hypothetical protein
MLEFRVYRKTENSHFWGGPTPFFSTSHRRHRGRAADNLPINFGENRLANENFSFLGVVRPLFPKFLPAT